MFPKLMRIERKLVQGVFVDVKIYEDGFPKHCWWGSEPTVFPTSAEERMSYYHEPQGFTDLEEGVKLEAGRRYYLNTIKEA